MRLSWFIMVRLKSNHMHPYKWEAAGNRAQTEDGRHYIHRGRERSNAVSEYCILSTSEFELWVPLACHMA